MKRSISRLGPARVLDRRQRGLPRRLERPVRRCRRPLLDPAAQHRDLRGGQLLAALLWRHQQIGVVGLDPVDQLALIRLAGHDRGASAFELGERAFLGVEPQPGLALVVVGTVAGEAIVREDRPDVAGVVHRRRRGVAFFLFNRVSTGRLPAAEHQHRQHDSHATRHTIAPRVGRAPGTIIPSAHARKPVFLSGRMVRYRGPQHHGNLGLGLPKRPDPQPAVRGLPGRSSGCLRL